MKLQSMKYNHWLTMLSDVKDSHYCQGQQLEKNYAKGSKKKVSNFISKLRLEWEIQQKVKGHMSYHSRCGDTR